MTDGDDGRRTVYVIQSRRNLHINLPEDEWRTISETVFARDGSYDPMTPRTRRECEAWFASKPRGRSDQVVQWRIWNAEDQIVEKEGY